MKRGLKVLGLALGVVAIMALTLGGTVFADTPEEMDVQTYCAGYGWHSFQGEGQRESRRLALSSNSTSSNSLTLNSSIAKSNGGAEETRTLLINK